MGMVLDPKFDKNHGADPAERPPIRVKAGLQGASTQHLQQLLPLRWGETGWTPRHAAPVQAAQVPLTLSQLSSPAVNSSATDAHLARNGRLGEVASLQQPTGFQTAFFKLYTGELSWSPYHGAIVN
jgi:hypothetical protein